jgi:hypothetical protein
MLKALTRILPIGGLLLLAAAPVRAADEKQIKESIDRAIRYLKESIGQPQTPQGVQGLSAGGAGFVGPGEGPMALAGIALIEANVGRDDPTIQGIANQIRAAAIGQNQTYQLSLDIIFLDKLGDPIDTILIQSMAVRLMFAQNNNGGWSYKTPRLTQGEQQRLRQMLQGAAVGNGKNAPGGSSEPDNRPKLDPVIQDMIKNRSNLEWAPGDGATPSDDNSNTQFAVIALWSARKHGMPVEGNLKAIDARFRRSQGADGGWGYVYGGNGTPSYSTPPMTAAGLIGLAIATGSKHERSMRSRGTFVGNKFEKKSTEQAAPTEAPINIAGDANIQAGLRYLGFVLAAANGRAPQQPPRNPGPGGPIGGGGRRPPGAGMPAGPGIPGPGVPGGGVGGPGPGIPPGAGGGLPGATGPQGEDLRSNLYFMWSLERTCMVYGLSKIGDIDWHDWGAKYLLQSQHPNGSWTGNSGHYSNNIVDTAFGLMFMSRANLVKDLSKMIERSMDNNKKVSLVDPKKPGGKAAPSTDTGDAEVNKLVQELLKAGAAKQLELIEEYKKATGTKYSLALAAAIRGLKDDVKTTARDALAERMARLSAKSLTSYMDADDPELSRAACLGVAMRDEKSLIPELIKHLDDTDEIVWRAAALALKTISGEDHGPKKGATDAQRDKAIKDWKAWYEKFQKAEKSGENTSK